MKDTLYGLIHHFFYSDRFSAENCSSHMKLLHRIIQFYFLAFVEQKIDPRGT